MADTTTVLNRLITALTTQDPTWDVGVGTAEYKILEAVANEIATAANNNTLQNYSFNIATKYGVALDNFCAIFGIFRNQGKRATGTATFYTATPGLSGGTLTIQNATTGYLTVSYTGSGQTSSQVTVAQFNTGTFATDQSNLTAAITSVLPGSIVSVTETSQGIFNVNISPTLSTGSLTFDFSNLVSATTLVTSWAPTGGATSNYGIPLNTQIYATASTTGSVPIYFQTTTAAFLPQSQSSIQVPIQAVNTGSNANLGAGSIGGLSAALTGITSVSSSVTSGGTDPETDAQLKQRWQNTVFKNLAGTDDQFRALALNNQDTKRVEILGPQSKNTENLQIQTTIENIFKTGYSNFPNNSVSSSQQLVANITGTAITTQTATITAATVGTATSFPYSGYVQYTTSGNHNFMVGQVVTITGVSPSGYNGTYSIYSIPSLSTFVVISNNTTSYSSGGTVNGAFTKYTYTSPYNNASSMPAIFSAGDFVSIEGITETGSISSTNTLNTTGIIASSSSFAPSIISPYYFYLPNNTTTSYSSGGTVTLIPNSATADSSDTFTICPEVTINTATWTETYTNNTYTAIVTIPSSVDISGIVVGAQAVSGTFASPTTLIPFSSGATVSSIGNNTITLTASSALTASNTPTQISFGIPQTVYISSAIANGTTVTYTTNVVNTVFQTGQYITITNMGSGVTAYNSWNISGTIVASGYNSFTLNGNPTLPSFSITGATPSTPSSGNVTYTTSTANGFVPGQVVTITGVSPSGYNGTFTIVTVPTATTFTVTNATTGTATTSSATATISQVMGGTATITYSGITPVSVLQNYLNNAYANPPISDFSQLVTINPFYNNGILSINATGGNFTINTTANQNVNISAIPLPYNVNATKISNSTTGAILNFGSSGSTVLPTGSSSSKSVTGATASTPSSGNVQYTTAAAHGLAVGTSVTIAGFSPSGYNGTFTIVTVPTTTTFTVANATTGTATPTSATVTSTGAMQALSVTNLSISIPSGSIIYLNSGTNNQTFTTSSAVASGATSIPVTSQIPNYAYSSSTIITNISALGLQDVLNNLLSQYNIQCSVFRTLSSNQYTYSIDFYSTIYQKGIDVNGNIYYYYIPISSSYVNQFLIWNFAPLSGASTNATWTIPNLNSGTLAQTAAIEIVFSKPVLVPIVGPISSITNYNGAFTFLNTITSTIPNPQYFYPMGIESIASSSSSTTNQVTATPYTDYTYSSMLVSPSQAIVNITNNNNYSWLYEGNVIQFTYFYVDSVSRNIPQTSTTSGPTLYTNYVDVLIDGLSSTQVMEDAIINPSNSLPAPGNSGTFSSTNNKNWVLGDQLTNPPTGDLYYSFSQQPATQPWPGVYPQTIYMGPTSRTDNSCQWSTSTPSTVYLAGTVNLTVQNNVTIKSNYAPSLNPYVDIVVNANISTSFMPGPSTFQTPSGNTVWYAAYQGNTIYSCVIIAGPNFTSGGSETLSASISVIGATPSTPSNGNVQYTTATPHGFFPGQVVTISGFSPSGYNGTFTIVTVPTVPTTTTFTVANATTGTATPTSATATTGSLLIQTSISDPNCSMGDIGSIVTSTVTSFPSGAFITAVDPGRKFVISKTVTGTQSSNISVTGAAPSTPSSGNVTYTSNNHGFVPGQVVTIAGFSPSGYNGTFTVNTVTTTTFTVANATTGTATPTSATATSASASITISTIGRNLTPYSGALSTITPANLSPLNYTWLSGGVEPYPKSDIVASLVNNTSQETSYIGLTTNSASQNITTNQNTELLYYGMTSNFSTSPFPTRVTAYENNYVSVNNWFAPVFNGTTTPKPSGTGSSATSLPYTKYVVFSGDFYPIYDSTPNAQSVNSISGIGISQPTFVSRTITWSSGSNYIQDASAIASDIGSFVIVTNTAISTQLPAQIFINQVIPGQGYYVSINQVSNSSLSFSNSGTSVAATLISFSTMPLINQQAQLFSMEYYVNSAVQQVDSLIQQQRLVGVSTLTHGANYVPLLINLAIVANTNVNLNSLQSSVKNSISNYINNLTFLQPIQIANIIQTTISVQGVLNARLANSYDSSTYYGIQEVNPFMSFEGIDDYFSGSGEAIEFSNLEILNTYSGDIILPSSSLAQVFMVNIYVRSESDF